MKIAIIGSGNVGKALAKSSVKAGHIVTMTATSADKAAQSAKASGAHSAASNEEAVKDADLVIVAVPYDKLGEVFRGLGTAVDGKVVVDATNHINTQNGGQVADGAEVDLHDGSAARVDGSKRQPEQLRAGCQQGVGSEDRPADGRSAGSDGGGLPHREPSRLRRA